MSNDATESALEQRILEVCNERARFRALLVTGPPKWGKTHMCRALCARHRWLYVNATMDSGYLDTIVGREEQYGPEELVEDLRAACGSGSVPIVVVVDDIEPYLGLWRQEKQDAFFRGLAAQTGLAAGMVVVTRLRTAQELLRLVRDKRQVFDLVGEDYA